MTDTPPRKGARAQDKSSMPGPFHQRSGNRNTETLAVTEESVRVTKRTVERENVRVRLITDEVDEVARVNLKSERLETERVPIGREIERAPSVREDGDVMIIPVVEEIVVMEKRLVLKEELHIRRIAEVREVAEPVTVRRQRAEIERVSAADNTPAELLPPDT